MRDIQASLKWITDILKELKIPFQIAGGLAAIAYGSKRDLNDIDIDIPEEKFDLLKDRVSDFIISGPSHVKDDHWDLLLMTLNHHGQFIDISGAYQTKIFNHSVKKWHSILTDFSKALLVELFELNVPIISQKELLDYKKILARPVDLVDIKEIEEAHLVQLHQFIEQYNFATLISHHKRKIDVSHAPVILNKNLGKYGTLAWHFAKKNPQVNAFNDNSDAVLIFHGPHAYISPLWYMTAPHVPTWNYAVVRAYGQPKIVDIEKLSEDLSLLTEKQEKNSSYVLPEDYKKKLLPHVVGFQMEITKINNTFKLGQDYSIEDQEGMISGLLESDTGSPLAEFIQSMQIKITKD
jgi:transcriptional regulator